MTNTPTGRTSPSETQRLSQEETDLWASLSKEFDSPPNVDDTVRDGLHPAIAFGLFGALLAHGAIILSLPPVIRGKGAPFLPTASKGLNTMFKELRNQPIVKDSKRNLTFFDLGSGDGRVVFRAAREGMFHKSIGYEINPVLYGWANLRRACQAPKYWSSTNFHIKDLWKVDLSKADVVAVYGLHPIMKQLGKKMKAELKPGSIVVSNVFTIPGWRPIRGSTDRVHFYSIPESIINVQKKSYSK